MDKVFSFDGGYCAAFGLLLFVMHAMSPNSSSGGSSSRSTSERPVIGINASFSPNATESGTVSLPTTYVEAVTAAGGIPIILPSLADPTTSLVQQQVNMCDGFIFAGGPDIDPARYGQPLTPLTRLMPPRREIHDFALISSVLASQKPFLAICLGCQEVNVALGGTLMQDICAETSTTVRHYGRQDSVTIRHTVEIEQGTILHDIMCTNTLSTNSSHHQAVLEPASRLKVSARSEDGVVECLELRDHPFGLAVQWHPERLTSEPLHLRLFEELVSEARQRSLSRGR